jgi:hypothetical protein
MDSIMKKDKFLLFSTGLLILALLPACIGKEFKTNQTYYETEYRDEAYSETVKTITTSKAEDIIKPKVLWFELALAKGAGGLYPIVNYFDNGAATPMVERGVWYYGYTLPKHTSGQVEIAIEISFGMKIGSRSNSPQAFAYDVASFGFTEQCPCRMPTYLIYDQQWPMPYYPPGAFSNQSPYETDQAQRWINDFNSRLGVSRALPNEVKNNSTDNMDQSETRIFRFNTTGVEKLAIIIGGWNYAREPLENTKFTWSDDQVDEKIVTRTRQVPVQVQKQRVTTETRMVPFWEALLSR